MVVAVISGLNALEYERYLTRPIGHQESFNLVRKKVLEFASLVLISNDLKVFLTVFRITQVFQRLFKK